MPTYLSLAQQRLCAAILVPGTFPLCLYTSPEIPVGLGGFLPADHRLENRWLTLPGNANRASGRGCNAGYAGLVGLLSIPMRTVTWDGLYSGMDASLA